jgi:Heterokaryon incompatibility protein (HET)
MLCSPCQQLAFALANQSENGEIPYGGKALLSLGKRPRKISCDLCRYFLSLSPSYSRNYKLHVRLFDRFDVARFDPKHALAGSLAHVRTPFLSVLRENAGIYYNYSVQEEIFEAGVIAYVPAEHERSISSTLHLIEGATADWGLLGSWINHCQISHVMCRLREDRHIGLPYIYFIDCIQGKVVQASTSERYLALSYVWGQSTNRPAAVQGPWPEGSFSFSDAPLTVQDAVRVVRNLQMKFLWVDKYCINQGREDERKMMLGNMDQIYENAEATIVAIYGENDEAGLPGVSIIPRKPQPRFQITQGCLISSCPPIKTVLNASVWATRGWTYQEARLSRRCLFFTEYQVYSVCRETTRSEALPSESHHCWISLGLNYGHLDARLYGEGTAIMDGFIQDRFSFSRRRLSYESDILDAFRGILSRSPFVTFWGVPITLPGAKMDPHTGLALGLLWCRREKTPKSAHLKEGEEVFRRRRAGFPTWSWASVTGEVFNQLYGAQSIFGKYLAGRDDISNQNDADIHFSLESGGEWVSLDEVMQQRWSNILPENSISPSLLVQGYIVRVVSAQNGLYRLYDFDQLDPPFLFAFLDLDQDQQTIFPREEQKYEEAVMLFEWNDDQKAKRKRFMLMLLTWLEDGIAERRGLLGDYRSEYDSETLAKIPKCQRAFILT